MIQSNIYTLAECGDEIERLRWRWFRRSKDYIKLRAAGVSPSLASRATVTDHKE